MRSRPRIARTADGFVAHEEGGATRAFAWEAIAEMIAYKVDYVTIDQIRLEIFLAGSDAGYTVTEEIDGFGLFVEDLSESLPGYDAGWHAKVVFPAFERNETVVYRRVKGG